MLLRLTPDTLNVLSYIDQFDRKRLVIVQLVVDVLLAD